MIVHWSWPGALDLHYRDTRFRALDALLDLELGLNCSSSQRRWIRPLFVWRPIPALKLLFYGWQPIERVRDLRAIRFKRTSHIALLKKSILSPLDPCLVCPGCCCGFADLSRLGSVMALRRISSFVVLVRGWCGSRFKSRLSSVDPLKLVVWFLLR